MSMTLEEILKQSPDIEGYGGGKWAMYSVHCCWWTSFPEDLGKLPPVTYKSGRITANPGGPSLPCCPHCKSILMQAPLAAFVTYAEENQALYGKGGLAAFVAAHSRNADRCQQGWDLYTPGSPDRIPPGRFA